jgi:hypothetical protein
MRGRERPVLGAAGSRAGDDRALLGRDPGDFLFA